MDLVVKCNFIQIHNDVNDGDPKQIAELMESFKEFWSLYEKEPIKGRNIIINSLCPEVSICTIIVY